MLHLYSLIWYKNYVRCTDIRVISGCFCSYSSMKLLNSVVCISIILFGMRNIATILSLYEVMTVQSVHTCIQCTCH